MAKFTRAEIRNILGDACTEEIENRLVALHLGVVDPLKDDLTKYKADAEKLPGVQKELDDLKAAGDGGFKEKFEKEHSDFENFKKTIQEKETKAAKESAAKAFFESKGITGNSLEIAMRGSSTEIAALDLDGEKIKDSSALDALVNGTFKALVSTTTTKGANIPNPPVTTPNKSYSADDIRKMSPAEINKNWDSIKASLNGKGD